MSHTGTTRGSQGGRGRAIVAAWAWPMVVIVAALLSPSAALAAKGPAPALPPLKEADWSTAGAPDLLSAEEGWKLPAAKAAKAAQPAARAPKRPDGVVRRPAKKAAAPPAAAAKAGKLRGSVQFGVKPAGRKNGGGGGGGGGGAFGNDRSRPRMGRVVFGGAPEQAVYATLHLLDLSNPGPGNRHPVLESTLLRVDLRTGRPTGRFALPPGTEAVAAGGDGVSVLTVQVGKDTKEDEVGRVDLWRLPKAAAGAAGKPEHVAGWAPYADENGIQEVDWSAVLSDELVLTRHATGRLALWKLPECQAVWAMETAGSFVSPALSADRKYLAVTAPGGVFVLDSRSGDAPGKYAWEKTGGGELAWHPGGAKLAAVADGAVAVWDLAAGQQTANFTLPKGTLLQGMAYTGFAWSGDRHLVLNGELLLDLELGAVVWHYVKPHAPPEVVGGQPDARFWTVAGNDFSTLVGVELPHAEARKAIEGAAGQDMLAVAPGSVISLQVNLPPEAADRAEAVRKRMNELVEQAGHTVAPDGQAQPIQLSLNVQPGAGQQVRYGEGLFGRRNVQTVTAPTYDCRLTLTADGQEVWAHQRNTGGSHPSTVQLREGTTIQQYLDESNAKSYEWFLGSLPGLPRRVAKPTLGAGGKPGLGSSAITPAGVVPVG